MAWEIEISETARKQLMKLDHQAKENILKYLKGGIAPTEDPRSFGDPVLSIYGRRRKDS